MKKMKKVICMLLMCSMAATVLFGCGVKEGAADTEDTYKVVLLVPALGDQSFYDAAKAKELALSQYKSGADVVYLGASTGNSGILDAAKELQKYTIGVDTDQALLYEETDSEKAYTIITSGIKALDTAIYNAIKLAKDHIYEEIATDSVKEWVTKAEEDLKAGNVTVSSAFTMTTEEVEAMRDAAATVK